MEKVTIEFNQQEMEIVSSALIELPYKKVIRLINSINEQISHQLEAQGNQDDSNNAL